jgi:hypothetical protein
MVFSQNKALIDNRPHAFGGEGPGGIHDHIFFRQFKN